MTDQYALQVDNFFNTLLLEPRIKGPSGCFICVHTFTPEEATAILAVANIANRAMLNTNLSKLCTTRAEGSWVVNLDPIVFTTKRALVNGQHRLAMVKQQERNETFICVFNAPTDVSDGLDRGRPWSLSAKSGVSPDLIAAASLGCRLRHGTTQTLIDSAIRTEYEQHQASYDLVISAARRRQSFRKAFLVTPFVFAMEAQGGQYKNDIITLLYDLVEHRTTSTVSAAISKLAETFSKHQGGQHARLDASLQVLRGLQAFCENEDRKILRATTDGLLFFCPTARYRLNSVSPTIGIPPKRPRA